MDRTPVYSVEELRELLLLDHHSSSIWALNRLLGASGEVRRSVAMSLMEVGTLLSRSFALRLLSDLPVEPTEEGALMAFFGLKSDSIPQRFSPESQPMLPEPFVALTLIRLAEAREELLPWVGAGLNHLGDDGLVALGQLSARAPDKARELFERIDLDHLDPDLVLRVRVSLSSDPEELEELIGDLVRTGESFEPNELFEAVEVFGRRFGVWEHARFPELDPYLDDFVCPPWASGKPGIEGARKWLERIHEGVSEYREDGGVGQSEALDELSDDIFSWLESSYERHPSVDVPSRDLFKGMLKKLGEWSVSEPAVAFLLLALMERALYADAYLDELDSRTQEELVLGVSLSPLQWVREALSVELKARLHGASQDQVVDLFCGFFDHGEAEVEAFSQGVELLESFGVDFDKQRQLVTGWLSAFGPYPEESGRAVREAFRARPALLFAIAPFILDGEGPKEWVLEALQAQTEEWAVDLVLERFDALIGDEEAHIAAMGVIFMIGSPRGRERLLDHWRPGEHQLSGLLEAYLELIGAPLPEALVSELEVREVELEEARALLEEKEISMDPELFLQLSQPKIPLFCYKCSCIYHYPMPKVFVSPRVFLPDYQNEAYEIPEEWSGCYLASLITCKRCGAVDELTPTRSGLNLIVDIASDELSLKNEDTPSPFTLTEIGLRVGERRVFRRATEELEYWRERVAAEPNTQNHRGHAALTEMLELDEEYLQSLEAIIDLEPADLSAPFRLMDHAHLHQKKDWYRGLEIALSRIPLQRDFDPETLEILHALSGAVYLLSRSRPKLALNLSLSREGAPGEEGSVPISAIKDFDALERLFGDPALTRLSLTNEPEYSSSSSVVSRLRGATRVNRYGSSSTKKRGQRKKERQRRKRGRKKR